MLTHSRTFLALSLLCVVTTSDAAVGRIARSAQTSLRRFSTAAPVDLSKLASEVEALQKNSSALRIDLDAVRKQLGTSATAATTGVATKQVRPSRFRSALAWLATAGAAFAAGGWYTDKDDFLEKAHKDLLAAQAVIAERYNDILSQNADGVPSNADIPAAPAPQLATPPSTSSSSSNA